MNGFKIIQRAWLQQQSVCFAYRGPPLSLWPQDHVRTPAGDSLRKEESLKFLNMGFFGTGALWELNFKGRWLTQKINLSIL